MRILPWIFWGFEIIIQIIQRVEHFTLHLYYIFGCNHWRVQASMHPSISYRHSLTNTKELGKLQTKIQFQFDLMADWLQLHLASYQAISYIGLLERSYKATPAQGVLRCYGHRGESVVRQPCQTLNTEPRHASLPGPNAVALHRTELWKTTARKHRRNADTLLHYVH